MNAEYHFFGHRLSFDDKLLKQYEKAFGKTPDHEALVEAFRAQRIEPVEISSIIIIDSDKANKLITAGLKVLIEEKEEKLKKLKLNHTPPESKEMVKFEYGGRDLYFEKELVSRFERAFDNPLTCDDIEESIEKCYGRLPGDPGYDEIPTEELNKRVADDLKGFADYAIAKSFEDLLMRSRENHIVPVTKGFPDAIDHVVTKWKKLANKAATGSCFPLEAWIMATYEGVYYKISARYLDIDREAFMDLSDKIIKDLLKAGCDSAEFFQVYD